MGRVSPAQAASEGFIIDRSCYPWIAYRGPRFNPRETREVLTEIEAEALWLLREILYGMELHGGWDGDDELFTKGNALVQKVLG